jgi:hypothetical protein
MAYWVALIVGVRNIHDDETVPDVPHMTVLRRQRAKVKVARWWTSTSPSADRPFGRSKRLLSNVYVRSPKILRPPLTGP